ncbi:hypothetical protein DL769_004908 [Monosporascus sp. CRB-8-3]|nr:hypothetical protein DL769_004908 [Monosporascus sp. CRB-8-3]
MKSLRSLLWASGSSNTHNRIVIPNYQTIPEAGTRRTGLHIEARWTSLHYASRTRRFPHSSSLQNREVPEAKPTPTDPSLPERFRAVMRQMPHPVVIITTLDCPQRRRPRVDPTKGMQKRSSPSFPSSSSHEDDDDGDRAPPPHWTSSDVADSRSSSETKNGNGRPRLRPIPRAMTVSSFTSLSLRPREKVLFNIALPSRTYHAIFSSGRFNAHVLAGDEHGARLADLFTKGYSGLNDASAGAGAAQEQEEAGRGGRGLGVLAGLEEYGVEVLGKREWDAEWDAAANVDGCGGAGHGREVVRYTAPLLRGRGVMHVLKCDLYAPGYLNNAPPECRGRSSSAARIINEDRERDNFCIMLGDVTEIVHGDGAGSNIALAYADGAYRMPGEQILKHAVMPPKR